MVVLAAVVRRRLVRVVIVGVVVAESLHVLQRPEGRHGRVGLVVQSAHVLGRVLESLGVARRLGRLPELLPDAVDEGAQQPEGGVVGRAVDVTHVAADERLYQRAVVLQLRVRVGDDLRELRLLQHVSHVRVADEVVTGPRRRRSPCRLRERRRRLGGHQTHRGPAGGPGLRGRPALRCFTVLRLPERGGRVAVVAAHVRRQLPPLAAQLLAELARAPVPRAVRQVKLVAGVETAATRLAHRAPGQSLA